jgi:hypothetical protein
LSFGSVFFGGFEGFAEAGEEGLEGLDIVAAAIRPMCERRSMLHCEEVLTKFRNGGNRVAAQVECLRVEAERGEVNQRTSQILAASGAKEFARS